MRKVNRTRGNNAYNGSPRGFTLPSSSQNGSSLLDYALLVALVSLIAVAGVAQVGNSVWAKFDEVDRGLASGAGNICPPDDPGCRNQNGGESPF